MTFLKVCLESFDRIDEISRNAHNRLLRFCGACFDIKNDRKKQEYLYKKAIAFGC
jgi:hypothetical protein